MITRIWLAAPLLLSSVLTGCCPQGCFVLHGNAYEKLAHPKPYVELWEKPDASAVQRNLDWVACGGASNGDFSPTIGRLKEEKSPNELNYDAAHSRLQQQLKRCMVAKGYHYIGQNRITTD